MLLDDNVSFLGLNLVVDLRALGSFDVSRPLSKPSEKFNHNPHITPIFPKAMNNINDRDIFRTTVLDQPL